VSGRPARRDTTSATVLTGPPGAGGYRRLAAGDGEEPLLRLDLGGSPPSGGLVSLLAFVHLSDLHVTDVQSPARAEFLDRLGDEDSPLAGRLGRVGTYRAQEALTCQVVEAMAQAVRAASPAGGPATGAPLSFAISTGDNIDNAQQNELSAYLALLDGGEVTPDSGDPDRYEGVGSPAAYDPRYWHPDGTPPGAPEDRPRAEHGFQTVPGLHDACRRTFRASGLGLPWYAVYGNHDALLVGTQPADEALLALATGSSKPTALGPGLDPVELIAFTETGPSPAAWGMLTGPTRPVTPDPRRRFVDAAGWLAAHLASPGQPAGHGVSAEAAAAGRAHYAVEAGVVRLLVLDSVNRDGGWQGSLDEEQAAWLEDELVAGHSSHLAADGRRVEGGGEDRLFVLAAHHSLETMSNPWSPSGRRRLLGDDLLALLARFPNVVCFVNGHTHEHAVRAFAPLHGTGGFWQVTTGSHIDWPQQSRLVELALDPASGDLVIATAVLDHSGLIDPRPGGLTDPLTLAGWSRELAANAWQGRSRPEEPWGRGDALDRNCLLVVPAPFPLAPAAVRAGAGAGVAR